MNVGMSLLTVCPQYSLIQRQSSSTASRGSAGKQEASKDVQRVPLFGTHWENIKWGSSPTLDLLEFHGRCPWIKNEYAFERRASRHAEKNPRGYKYSLFIKTLGVYHQVTFHIRRLTLGFRCLILVSHISDGGVPLKPPAGERFQQNRYLCPSVQSLMHYSGVGDFSRCPL